MASLLTAPRLVKTAPDPVLPPREDDPRSPERTHARLCTLAEAHADRAVPESAWLAGGYRVEYERLYDEHQATLQELARVRGVLSRVDDEFFPDELPNYS